MEVWKAKLFRVEVEMSRGRETRAVRINRVCCRSRCINAEVGGEDDKLEGIVDESRVLVVKVENGKKEIRRKEVLLGGAQVG